MYTQHFGMQRDPFSIAPDPRFLFMSERHREALAHLLFGVKSATSEGADLAGSGGGFVLLTGDIGTGKTTICRCFLEQIPADCHVAYIFNPKLDVMELLQSVCSEFHIQLELPSTHQASVKDYIDALNAFLLQAHANGQSCVLIIDEAQNLASDVLEQLRLLTNLETSTRKLLQIVLIGQPELRGMLARPELEQLAQRVIARFHLDALTASETIQYIGHRLSIAGFNGELPFTANALQHIHRTTGGVPRRINLLCGRALLGAWATGQQRVTPAVVDKAAREVFDARRDGSSKVPSAFYKQPIFALLVVAAVGLAVMWWNTGQQRTARLSDRPVAAPATSATSVAAPTAAPASVPVSTSTPAPTPTPAMEPTPGPLKPVASTTSIDSVNTVLPKLPLQSQRAWQELATVWKLPISSESPCQTSDMDTVQCYFTTKMTVPQLRQLARPGILTLHARSTAPVYAVLIGLSERTATLQVDGQTHTVRLVQLAPLWRGNFATFWKPPLGYQSDMQNGSTGPAVDWLASKLSQVEGLGMRNQDGAATVMDDPLRERVRAFQLARSIEPDGQPGPMTFMQLESALGLQSPKLILTSSVP